MDVVRDVAADKLLASLGPRPWLMLDGLDDIEERYLIPGRCGVLLPRRWTRTSSKRAITSWPSTGVPPRARALTRAGWSAGFTCHCTQNIRRVNADRLNAGLRHKLTYVSGKLGQVGHRAAVARLG